MAKLSKLSKLSLKNMRFIRTRLLRVGLPR